MAVIQVRVDGDLDPGVSDEGGEWEVDEHFLKEEPTVFEDGLVMGYKRKRNAKVDCLFFHLRNG